MSELTIKIEAPELSAAIQQLAEAMKPHKPAEQAIQEPKPAARATTIPVPTAPAVSVSTAPVTPAATPVPAVPVSATAAAPPTVRPATPIPAAMTAPTAQPVVPAVPVSAPVPAPAPTTPAAPVAPTSAPQYTFDMLFNATAQLMNQNKGAQLQQLLAKYNVQRLPDLPREQYGAFATDLRALGVRI